MKKAITISIYPIIPYSIDNNFACLFMFVFMYIKSAIARPMGRGIES